MVTPTNQPTNSTNIEQSTFSKVRKSREKNRDLQFHCTGCNIKCCFYLMRDKRFPGSPWGPWLPLYTTLPPTLETTISVWLEISSNIFKFLEQSTKFCTKMILIFTVWQQIVIVWSKFGFRSSFISLLLLFGFGIYF